MEIGSVVVERFVLLREAGAGGMGVVYQARDNASSRLVALKALRGGDPQLIERFTTEARILAELSHPGIVRYVSHGATAAGEPFLAMEWLVGEDLAARLRRGPLSVAETLGMAMQVCDALGAAHRRGIVHRDVKPQNLFLVADVADPDPAVGDTGELPGAKVVKVLDFGVARMGARAGTMTGDVIGTPAFIAPEQARGQTAVDGRADTFALGCVLFAALTQRPPFTGDHAAAVLTKILFDDTPSLRALRPDVPAALDELVAAMLEKEPAARPDDRALAESLARIAAGDGYDAAAPAPSSVGLLEQRYASLLMAGSPARPVPRDQLAALRATATAHGARVELLIDGTLVGVFTAGPHVTDAAWQAARCALALRGLVGGAPIAVVTGRGQLQSSAVPLGDLIDRASRMLSADRGEIRLDEVSRGLLDVTFVIDGAVLVGERDLTGGTRRVLGKATPCLGRERELATLGALFAESRSEPAARVALITAPSGMGKSRVREELLRRVGDTQVWIGRGDPMRRGAPYSILADALRRPLGIATSDDAGVRQERIRERVGQRFADPERARVAEFLGEICGTPFPDAQSAHLRAARQDPQLMGDQVRRAWERWLAAELQAGPIAIVLEDLHWGDWPSVKLLDAALRALAERPLMVLGVARPDIHDVFPGAWAGRGLEEIHLRPLPRATCARLVRELLGEGTGEEVVQRIAALSHGNPFYLEELARSVADGRGEELPETVLAMVDARLARLAPELRQVLRAASVFGEVFWDEALAALLGPAAAATLPGLLDELGELEWVVPVSLSRFFRRRQLRFTHAMLREAAYASLTADDRRLAHGLAGAWLERAGELNPLTLADHYERAEMTEPARFQLLRTAEQALDANDFDAAIRTAERAVTLGASGPPLGRLRLLQAEAHAWRFEHAEAESCARAAMAVLKPATDAWANAAHHVAWALSVLGKLDGLAALALDLTAALSSRPSPALLMATSVVAVKLMAAGGFEQAVPVLAAIEVSAPLGEGHPVTAAWLGNARAYRASFEGRPDEMLAALKQTLASWEEAGDERNACLARSNMAFAYLELGCPGEAVPLLEAVVEAAERMGILSVVEGARQNLGLALAATGDFDRARAAEELAVRAFRERGDARYEGISRLYLARVLTLAGDLDAAAREAEAAVELLRAIPPWRCYALAVTADVAARAGRPAQAHARAGEAFTLLEELGALEEGEPFVRLVWAEALGGAGEGAAASLVISAAAHRLRDRASRIADLGLRESFLTRVADHARTLQLAGD